MYTIIEGLPYFVNLKEKCLNPIVVSSEGVTIHTDKKVNKPIGNCYTLSLLQHVLNLNEEKEKIVSSVVVEKPKEEPKEETVEEKVEKPKASTQKRKTATKK